MGLFSNILRRKAIVPMPVPTGRAVARPIGRRVRTNTYEEYGNYSFLQDERLMPELRGLRQFRTYKVMMNRTPIVGVSTAQLMMASGKATYKIEPASDKPEDVRNAELMEHMLFGMLETSVSDVNKKLAMHTLNGFAVLEWDGYMDEDGIYCVKYIRDLPAETIVNFHFDPRTTLVSQFIQRTYEGQADIMVPRWKALYPVESATTNSPYGRSLLQSVGENALRWIQLAEGRHLATVANLRRRPTLLAPVNELREEFRTEVSQRMQATGNGEPSTDVINSRVDAMLAEVLAQPLGVIDADNPDPDQGFVFDSSVEVGDGVDNSTRPITMRKWELVYAPPIDTDKATATMVSLTQDMARELHMIALTRGDDGAGSYALAATQFTDVWAWCDSTIHIGLEQLQRLGEWLLAYNGVMMKDAPQLGVEESSFLSLNDEAELLLKAKMAALGTKGGLGMDHPAIQALMTRAGMPHDPDAEPVDDEDDKGGDAKEGDEGDGDG